MRYPYLVIEGNIGAGKTSLASLLANERGSRLVLEGFADNPFLAAFYRDPERYAFQVEMSFLAERYQQIKSELGQSGLFDKGIVSDYHLSKSLIFSKHNLKSDELTLFRRLFSIIQLQAPRPDLYVYLHVPVDKLLENIKHRNRSYERNIRADYLREIQEGYFAYFKTETETRIVVINTASLDFVNKSADYQVLKKLIFEGEYKPGINMSNL